MKFDSECGVTEVSEKNAAGLIAEKGAPIKLIFVSDTRRCEYFVYAVWRDAYRFRFTGFSWGYPGTGPAALRRLMRELQFPEDAFPSLPTNTRLELLVP